MRNLLALLLLALAALTSPTSAPAMGWLFPERPTPATVRLATNLPQRASAETTPVDDALLTQAADIPAPLSSSPAHLQSIDKTDDDTVAKGGLALALKGATPQGTAPRPTLAAITPRPPRTDTAASAPTAPAKIPAPPVPQTNGLPIGCWANFEEGLSPAGYVESTRTTLTFNGTTNYLYQIQTSYSLSDRMVWSGLRGTARKVKDIAIYQQSRGHVVRLKDGQWELQTPVPLKLMSWSPDLFTYWEIMGMFQLERDAAPDLEKMTLEASEGNLVEPDSGMEYRPNTPPLVPPMPQHPEVEETDKK